ncbi:hypothetical protein [Providencia manganoxydans]|uniref:hypothetical protein n=1 Tax=Providencia manganoxydans TaxID=2923283 RepID=UPI0029C014F5|nr:hypothetical protein [Providencia manganoxydans]MDX4944671.1 hypothetical protein [Providencia manganoxydans]
MRNVEDLGAIYVTADELPVIESPSLYFGDGCYGECDSITDRFRTDDLAGWYHAINDIMDYLLACEDASTTIGVEDLLDNICSSSEADLNSRTQKIKEHIDNQNRQLSELEATDEWKFLSDPESYPFEQRCGISDRLITKVYKTAQERANLLAGYNENMFNESWNEGWSDDYIFPDGDEGFLDSSARINLLVTKYFHDKITNGIKANQRNLIKLGIAKSSFFSIPVRSLPPSVGLSPEISDSHIARGVENTLGSIRDSLAETFDCTFGMSCSNDIDNAAKNPNLGKEFSNSDKVELGGTGSGTPDGWGPEDEAHARTHQIPSKEELKQGASEINRNGLTNAGRSLQKHGGREGSVYSYSNQKASVLNQEARAIIDEILDNPNVTIKSRTVYENRQRIEVIDARSPDGRTLRFSRDGKKFIGFREP